MPMRIGAEMPSLEGATEWFNATGARAAAEAVGHPTLVYFWAVSCEVCQRATARVGEWRDRRAAEGLKVIAVHTPHDETDADTEAVRGAVTTYGITEPCAVDNEHQLRVAFEHEKGDVPAYYLFDAEGRLQCFAAGERGLVTLGAELDRVLALSARGPNEATA